jgi:hypothetical protein
MDVYWNKIWILYKLILIVVEYINEENLFCP